MPLALSASAATAVPHGGRLGGHLMANGDRMRDEDRGNEHGLVGKDHVMNVRMRLEIARK
jgi:hypothetical protein